MDLFETPLAGLNLIEASAGTGKTFTITGLYLRLVVELGLSVEQILVVTYTTAATAELRDRIRSLLVSAHSSLEAGVGEEGICAELLNRNRDHQLAGRRLRHAILDFDKANISTIHGFCQRMLSDHAFESGLPFESEMLTDQRLLVQEVVDDFWRLRIQDLSPALVDYLLTAGFSPDELARILRGRLGRNYLELRGRAPPDGIDTLEAAFLEDFVRARDRWRQQRETVGQILLEAEGLNRGRYRRDWIHKWMGDMDGYLADVPGSWFEQFHKFRSSTLAASVKRGGQPPQHRFFEDCEGLAASRESLLRACEQARVALIEELFFYTNSELGLRKKARGVQFYDDLLVNLQQALEQDRDGTLRARIQSRCQAALIDEFQDTDPLQYLIFSSVFGQGQNPVFLVGDPKQAIYSFRGADIFAYLRAGRDATCRYSLDRNWRSTPELMKAINLVFSQSDNPFFYREIPYVEVAAGERPVAELTVQEEDQAPFRFMLLSGNPNKEQALELSVQSCAAEIARLIDLSRRGEARIGERPLAGSDVAVLVRSHRQGGRIKQALLALGIHSVQHSAADVFRSRSAVSLDLVLRAVAEPGREGLVLSALATDIMGANGEQLQHICSRESELEGVLDDFQEYHRLWLERGFMRMFRRLLLDHGVAARLLGLEEGERRLTDLLHLGELLHQQERAGRPGIELLMSWFSTRLQSESPEDETSQLRLESDDQLVRIVTIHKSKGLQYPIVFYPFGWDSGAMPIRKFQAYEFHDPEQDHKAVLELGSERWEQDRVYARREAMAERLRLLYVALTRAQQRCYLHWGYAREAGSSALAWLLHGPGDDSGTDPLEALESAFELLGEGGLSTRLEQLSASASGVVSVALCQPVVSAEPVQKSGDNGAAALRARSFDRGLQQARRVTSFSALAAGQVSVELPDHDAAAAETGSVEVARGERDIFVFPRGAGPGSCIHAVFENLDFRACERSALELLVTGQLHAFGIDTAWTAVVSDMVERVLATPLERASPRLRLNLLPPERCLKELGFYYPLDAIDGTGLARLLTQQGGVGSEPSLVRALEHLSFPRVQGFMKGFIDLVFQAEGRFYLVDYKSNWLGTGLEDYRQERLAEAMAVEHYYLQYLLYVLALHRYLGRRLEDYSYDRHFGAVYYLFVRGMSPASGPTFGVHRARPEGYLIEALDHYIGNPLGGAS